MASIYDFFDLSNQPDVPRPEADTLAKLHRVLDEMQGEFQSISQTGDVLNRACSKHASRMLQSHSDRSRKLFDAMSSVMDSLRAAQGQNKLLEAYQSYLRDAGERAVLAADALPRHRTRRRPSTTSCSASSVRSAP
jgi:hypothetical protein